MDYGTEANRHREMAEECRTMAECMTDGGVRVQYRKLAQAYDELADNEVRVAHNLKFSN